jgi:hypothetical protein
MLFVDDAMFRKRNEDARALRDFAKEVAFVTDRDALLELAIEKVRTHTDVRSGALLVRGNGSYPPFALSNESSPGEHVDLDQLFEEIRRLRTSVDRHFLEQQP